MERLLSRRSDKPFQVIGHFACAGRLHHAVVVPTDGPHRDFTGPVSPTAIGSRVDLSGNVAWSNEQCRDVDSFQLVRLAEIHVVTKQSLQIVDYFFDDGLRGLVVENA